MTTRVVVRGAIAAGMTDRGFRHRHAAERSREVRCMAPQVNALTHGSNGLLLAYAVI